MNIGSSYTATQLQIALSGPGVGFRVGPFHLSVKSDIPTIATHLNHFYREYDVVEDHGFIDFHISLDQPGSLRRWIKPQVLFSLDGYQPFTPLPLAQAAAQFEWGLNWCVAGLSHQYLIIHSAVIEKNGVSIIMPGQPGSGKSTLCAALVAEGWRLLSDEMALVSLDDLTIQPVPRPISLKNRSIDIIRDFQRDANFGPVIKGTTKGDVCHLPAPIESIHRQDEKADINLIVFPKFSADSQTNCQESSKARACMALIENSFNFNILGSEGFQVASEIIDRSRIYEIEYPSLDEALKTIDDIAGKSS